MPAHALRDDREPETVDAVALLQCVASLRDEVRSMAGHLQAVLEDNRRLRWDVERLHGEAPPPAPAAEAPTSLEARRFRRELEDQLERLRRVATAANRRARPGTAPPPEPPPAKVAAAPAPAAATPADAAWVKRMMIVMMMSELF